MCATLHSTVSNSHAINNCGHSFCRNSQEDRARRRDERRAAESKRKKEKEASAAKREEVSDFCILGGVEEQYSHLITFYSIYTLTGTGANQGTGRNRCQARTRGGRKGGSYQA